MDIRYVGWSGMPKRRLRRHINDAVKFKTSYLHRWIVTLLARGQKPVMDILENGNGDGWGECERKWIAFYRASGSILTNLTDGGGGMLGYRKSADQIARAAMAKRRTEAAKTQEQRSAPALKSWKSYTDEHKKKFFANGFHSLDPAKRSAIAVMREAAISPADRHNRAKARELAMSPDDKSKRSNAGWLTKRKSMTGVDTMADLLRAVRSILARRSKQKFSLSGRKYIYFTEVVN